MWKKWIFHSFLLSWEVYCPAPSQFMFRFECKEYQSRDIPPLLCLGFFLLPWKWYSFCSFFQLCLETHSREAIVAFNSC